jgi:hypothetical protein
MKLKMTPAVSYNNMFTEGASGQVSRERSAHHIPLPGTKFRQDGLSSESGSGTS